jgi:hypothetical protein
MDNLLKLMNYFAAPAEKTAAPVEKTAAPAKKTEALTEKKVDEYYVLKGFIPSDIGETTSEWDHVPKMQAAGTNAFVWCADGAWFSIVLKDYTVKENTMFINAPLCTTYIKKTNENVFLSSMSNRAYDVLGLKKRISNH